MADPHPKLWWEGKAPLDGNTSTKSATPPSPDLLRRCVAWTDPKGSGHLYRGENVEVLRALQPSLEGQVSLVYMDPPFFTNRVHATKAPPQGPGKDSFQSETAFDDRWDDLGAYLNSMGQCMAAARELLADHGCLVLHVDPRTSHYLRVLGDEIFGPDAFASEIIWRYRRWPSRTPNFQKVHDVLLRFRKDPAAAPRWNQDYEPLAPSTLAVWGTRKQRAVVGDHGRRLRSMSTEEATQGVPVGDVWDIGIIAPVSKERTGYPSQKPEKLMHRLIHTLSNPGDWVLDPYAGSGTTLAVAAALGRRFVGIDKSDAALTIAADRLTRTVASSKPDTVPSKRRLQARRSRDSVQGLLWEGKVGNRR